MMKFEDIIENYPDTTFLKADGFDDAILGVSEEMNRPTRLIYSKKKCIEILAKQMRVKKSELEEGQTVRDKKWEMALEYFEFNVSGAYVGEKTPIWCDDCW